MNYERFKKAIVSMALLFVFAFSTILTTVTPASAQGYYRRGYGGYQQRYYQPVYRYPYSGGYYRYGYGYNPYRYGIYNPYYNYQYYYPYQYQYQYQYPYGYGGYGRYHRRVY